MKRDGAIWEQRYERGKPVTKLKKISSSSRGSGTTMFFRPDADIFETVEFDPETIAENLETKTYLNGSLRIAFKNEVTGEKHDYHHEGGIEEYLAHKLTEAKARPVHPDPFVLRQEGMHDGARVEVTLQWTEAPRETLHSFVNGIPTSDGGTHEQGLKDAIRSAIRSYLDTHDLLPKKLEISADDIREGVFGIINLFMVDPQFQGQTKEKLNNPETKSIVSGAIRLELEQFLNRHPSTGEAIATRVIQAARARHASRAAANSVRRKSNVSHRLNLPGKLADCASTSPDECELFIVEGDSAGGSAKQGRDRATQAILPLRGKVLNAEQATLKKVMDNKELSNVVQAVGCGVGEALDISKLRYHKIILLMDADSDGHHISTLLLTFLYRYMRPLIEEGYVFIAQPPLFRMDSGKQTFWALDEADREKITAEIRKKNKNAKIEMQRFKGLGEMMPQTLKDTTLDPEKRRLLQVSIPTDERLLTETTISQLMGKDASARFDFIMNNVDEVHNLDV